MEIVYYNETIKKFIDLLEADTRKEVVKNVDLLREYGFKIGLPHSRSLGNGLFELRSIGTGVRFLYIFYNNKIMFLHGFIKKTDKIPKNELDTAKRRRGFLS